MFIGILLIVSAILLSIVSMVFSITGIITIFSGAALGAGIMAGVLEFSKISATLWLYSFWRKANFLMKTYFMIAVVILISISTLGIFGYLARAYVGQGESTQRIKTEIDFIEQSIQNEQEGVVRAQTQIDQMDENFSSMIEGNFITKGLEMRDSYEKERENLIAYIQEARESINDYQAQKLLYQQELNTLEINVGPVKYMAILLYGEDNAEQYYDNAARLLIILIVIVFDPFAVLLMVAGNIALDREPRKRRGRPKGSKNKKPPSIVEQEPKSENNEPVYPEVKVNKEVPPKIHKRRKLVSH